MEKTKIIAVSGKGGVGKTSTAALVVKLLVDQKPEAKILAIDADPAIGLATALEVEVKTTLDDIRKNFIDNMASGKKEAAIDVLNTADYALFEAMEEKEGFAFIAVGRPENAGCYCKVNTYLKDVISALADKFDYVVIDGEAGIEQVNRRVMEKVTHLLLISDASKKGTNVIQTIKRVADDLVMYDKIGAIINRVRDPEIKQYIDTGDIEILEFIEEDPQLNIFDIQGKSILDLPKDASSVIGVRRALEKVGVL